MPEMKKIKYIDEDDMRLVIGLGDPMLIKKGEIKEFPAEMAEQFLRDTKTVIKDKKVIKIPKWELVKVKEGKE